MDCLGLSLDGNHIYNSGDIRLAHNLSGIRLRRVCLLSRYGRIGASVFGNGLGFNVVDANSGRDSGGGKDRVDDLVGGIGGGMNGGDYDRDRSLSEFCGSNSAISSYVVGGCCAGCQRSGLAMNIGLSCGWDRGWGITTTPRQG